MTIKLKHSVKTPCGCPHYWEAIERIHGCERAFVELDKEKEALRQRVEELEEAVIHWRQVVRDCHDDYKQRGERMKAMREWIENDPEDNGGISFVEHYGAYKWFDPETGEPL